MGVHDHAEHLHKQLPATGAKLHDNRHYGGSLSCESIAGVWSDIPEGSVAVKEISVAINNFSDEYKVPFTMYLAGYKYNEIAEKCRCLSVR